MFETSPPPPVAWVDIFLSAIAFGLAVVTLPTAFQMWWGRPAINVEFSADRMDVGTSLKCYIYNDFIKTNA